MLSDCTGKQQGNPVPESVVGMELKQKKRASLKLRPALFAFLLCLSAAGLAGETVTGMGLSHCLPQAAVPG